MRPALVVVVPPGPPEAAALGHAALLDSLDAWAGGDRFGVTPAPPVRLYVDLADGEAPPAPAGVTVHRQRGAGLGARLLRATIETFASGADRVVVLWAGYPTLPDAFVGETFRALADPFTVVLGPTETGGLYLIGVNELLPALYDGLTDGSPGLFDRVLERAGGLAHPAVLPAWYGVDTPEGQAQLRRDVSDGAPIGPRTHALLDVTGPASP